MIEGTVSLKCSRCNHCEVCQWVDLKMNGCDWFEEEPKTGHWIRQNNTKEPLYGWYFCSECNSVIGDKTKFCSNCGARMIEPQESEEV